MSGAAAGAVPGLLVTHGPLGEALKATAERIAGPVDGLGCFSNDGLHPGELTARLAARLDELGSPVVLLIDLAGGSTLAAAQRACRGRVGVHLVAGINLPLLLDFIQKRATLPPDELVAHVIERGRAGLRPVPLPPG